MAPVTPARIYSHLARAATTLTTPTKILPRQVVVTVTPTPESTAESASNSNLSGGAIAGIVIGSVAGFLILLWILKSCGLWGQPNQWGDKDPPPHHHDYRGRSPGSRHHRRHQHRYHHETSRSRRRPSYEVEEVRYAQPVVYEKRRPSASPRPPAAVYRSSRSRTRY